jgi:hypothetical protein
LPRPDSGVQPYSAKAGHVRLDPRIVRLGASMLEAGDRLVEVAAGTALRPWIDRGLLTVGEQPAPARWICGEQVQWMRQAIGPDIAAFTAYEVQDGEQVPSLAAAWLWAIRGIWERGGILTAAAWCTSCGVGCIDHRQSPKRIRQWCDRCVKLSHRPEWCQCPGCEDWFRITHGNLYCSDRCRKAETRRLKRQQRDSAAFSGPNRP